MKLVNGPGTLVAIGMAVAVAACASLEATERSDRTTLGQAATGAAVPGRSDRTAVSQAANGAIVGCASNAASNDDAQSQRRPLSPLCSRKS